MTQERELADRLFAIGKSMDALPPYEKDRVPLSRGELAMIVKALVLLDAIRISTAANR